MCVDKYRCIYEYTCSLVGGYNTVRKMKKYILEFEIPIP